eukprot:1343334-Rhodomonas_salina.1
MIAGARARAGEQSRRQSVGNVLEISDEETEHKAEGEAAGARAGEQSRRPSHCVGNVPESNVAEPEHAAEAEARASPELVPEPESQEL